MNWPLAIATAVALAVLLPGIYFWHSYQVARNAVALLLRADQFEARQAWGDAARCLYQYLKLRPDEAQARVRLAKDFAAAAKTLAEKARAVQLYAAAIGAAPDQIDLVRRQMTLLLDVGDYSTALQRSEDLLGKNPDDPAALRVKALAQYEAWRLKGNRRPADLVAPLEQALQKDPADAVVAERLARLYRTHAQDPARADEVLERLVSASRDKGEVLLIRYRFRKEFGLPEADADLDAAIAADAEHDDFSTQLLAGQRALARGQWDSAQEHLERVIAAAPADVRGYLSLGEVYAGQNDVRRALEVWDRGLASAGGKDLGLMFRIASAEVRLGELKAAEQTLGKLDKLLISAPDGAQSDRLSLLTVLRAEVAMQRKDYLGDVTLLRRAIVQGDAGAETPDKAARKADLLLRLGHCYSVLEQGDQAAVTLELAATLQPDSIPARLKAAAAWEIVGRLDDALRHYEAAIQRHEEGSSGGKNLPVSTYESLCDVLSRQQRAQPAEQRDWIRFQAAYAKAQTKAPDSVLLQLIGAEYEALQGNLDLAQRLLQEAEDAALRDANLSRRLIVDFEVFGFAQDADRLIQRLRQADARGVSSWLLQADLLARRGEFAAALQQLRLALGVLPADMHPEVNSALAALYLAHGKVAEARKELEELATDKSFNRKVRALQLLTEIDLNSGDSKRAEGWESTLRELEGAEGTSWRFYRAQRLMNDLVKQGVNGGELLREALQLHDQIERLRPNWAPGHLLKARLCQLGPNVDLDAAIAAYEQALKLGRRDIRIYQELLSLLLQQYRLVMAGSYLDQLRATVQLPPELTVLSMAIDAERGNLPRAISTARDEVAREPNDAVRLIRLGQLLALQQPGPADSFNQEAEATLKRAKELAPEDLRTWSALLTFYAGHGASSQESAAGSTHANNLTGDQQPPAAAQALLEELQATQSIPDKDRLFFLAEGYALLKRPEEADRFYQQAVAANPRRAELQLAAAKHFFTRDQDQSLQCLRQVMQLTPADATARRMLATLLANRVETDQDLQDVWRLLKGAGGDSVDRRMQAIYLLQRSGSEQRARAQRLLESLVADPKNKHTLDHLLLARLYEAQGQTSAAREQLQALVQRDNPSAGHLAIYIDHLLKSGRLQQAGEYLNRLSSLEPETTSLRTLQLRARLLKEQRQEAEIGPLFDSHLQKNLLKQAGKKAEAQLLVTLGQTLSGFELHQLAEAYYRQAIVADSATIPAYCMWLTECGRASEALRTCLQSSTSGISESIAVTIAQVLTLGQVSREEREAAEPILNLAIEQHARHLPLVFSVASLRILEGKNEEAVRLLRQACTLNPHSLVVLNNLALVLAMTPEGRKEALQHIDRAIAIAGEDPELLDSKGWILLQQRRAAEAEALFREAISLPPGDPRHHFHLALACQGQGKDQDARQAFQRARSASLSLSLLTPQERSQWAVLEEAYP